MDKERAIEVLNEFNRTGLCDADEFEEAVDMAIAALSTSGKTLEREVSVYSQGRIQGKVETRYALKNLIRNYAIFHGESITVDKLLSLIEGDD